MSSINLVLRSRPKVGVSKDGHGRGRASGDPSRRRAAHGSSEREKESPDGVARPQNVEYSTPKRSSRESKFPPDDLSRNVILPRHPKFDSFTRSEEPCAARRLEGWTHGTDSRLSFETPTFGRLLRMRASIISTVPSTRAGQETRRRAPTAATARARA